MANSIDVPNIINRHTKHFNSAINSNSRSYKWLKASEYRETSNILATSSMSYDDWLKVKNPQLSREELIKKQGYEYCNNYVSQNAELNKNVELDKNAELMEIDAKKYKVEGVQYLIMTNELWEFRNATRRLRNARNGRNQNIDVDLDILTGSESEEESVNVNRNSRVVDSSINGNRINSSNSIELDYLDRTEKIDSEDDLDDSDDLEDDNDLEDADDLDDDNLDDDNLDEIVDEIVDKVVDNTVNSRVDSNLDTTSSKLTKNSKIAEANENKMFDILRKLNWPDKDESRKPDPSVIKRYSNDLKDIYPIMMQYSATLEESLKEVINFENIDFIKYDFLFHVLTRGKDLYYTLLSEPTLCTYLIDLHYPLYTMIHRYCKIRN